MASINTTARLESKIDAQNALIAALRDSQDTLRDSQDTKYRALLWVIGVSAAVISITLTLISTLGGGG